MPPIGADHGPEAAVEEVVDAAGPRHRRGQLGDAEHGRDQRHRGQQVGEHQARSGLLRRQAREQEEPGRERGPGGDGVDVEQAELLLEPAALGDLDHGSASRKVAEHYQRRSRYIRGRHATSTDRLRRRGAALPPRSAEPGRRPGALRRPLAPQRLLCDRGPPRPGGAHPRRSPGAHLDQHHRHRHRRAPLPPLLERLAQRPLHLDARGALEHIASTTDVREEDWGWMEVDRVRLLGGPGAGGGPPGREMART